MNSLTTLVLRGLIAAAMLPLPGCFSQLLRQRAESHPTTSVVLSDPAGAVFAHCRELVCTQADVPSCEFEQTSQAVIDSTVERIYCSRSPFGTDCEERHAPGSQDDHAGVASVLKFRCSGDPVECWRTGGNADWKTALDPSLTGGLPIQYPCAVHRVGPAPLPQPVPGPDTV